MAELKQYGILVMGLLLGGGFAFGGIASYAGIGGSSGSSSDQQEFNATLPQSNFQEGSFGLSQREQLVLAAQNDVVFVNAYYSDEDQKSQLQALERIQSDFGERVYVNIVASSEDEAGIVRQYGLTQFPKIVVLGGKASDRGIVPVTEIVDGVKEQQISDGICSGFEELGSAYSQCVG